MKGEIYILLLSGVLGILLLPFPMLKGLQYPLVSALILAIFSLSYNLTFGYAGRLSLGHAGFFALGAYSVGWFFQMLFYSTPLMLIFAMAFSIPLGLAIGIILTRYSGYHYAMLTLMVGMVVYAILWKWVDVTGGDMGIRGFPRGFIGPLDLQPVGNYYFFVLIVFTICMLIFYRIDKSFFGLTLKSIRENSERAEGIGVNVKRVFILCFLLSAIFSSLSGALGALLLRAVHPSLSDWSRSFEPVLACVLGGANFFEGPIIGALLYSVIKDILMRRTEFWLMYMGLILVSAILMFREGIAFYIRKLRRQT